MPLDLHAFTPHVMPSSRSTITVIRACIVADHPPGRRRSGPRISDGVWVEATSALLGLHDRSVTMTHVRIVDTATSAFERVELAALEWLSSWNNQRLHSEPDYRAPPRPKPPAALT